MVSVLGHFGEGKNLLNGQTVKTKIVTEELRNKLGQDQVICFDTHGGLKTLLKAPIQVVQALKKSSNVLIFPAHNGLRVYAPLLSLLSPFFKNRKIHYLVIGGWLPEFLFGRKCLAKSLKKFDGIYVETNSMKNALEIQGFVNVFVMPNCKKLRVLSKDELVYPTSAPYKLCTFSRVMKEKGIENAVSTVSNINSLYGRTVCTLDIYGQVDSNQIDWFENLKLSFNDAVKYCGVVPFNETVDILKEYYALLFPTEFYTEGIPGTLIDAYAAGVPVIASAWESVYDIVESDITGIVYPFGESDGLQNSMITFIENPDRVFAMKENCLERSLRYSSDAVMDILISRLD